jgi:hypothetical protein
MTVKSRKITESRLFSAFIMAALTVTLLVSIQAFTTGSGPRGLTMPVALATTDSSSCIACHTDASVIERMAFVAEETDEPAAGGG